MNRIVRLIVSVSLLGPFWAVTAQARSSAGGQLGSTLHGCWDRVGLPANSSEQTICFDGRGRLSVSYLSGGGTFPPQNAGDRPIIMEIEGWGELGTYALDGRIIAVTLDADHTWIGDRETSVCTIVPQGNDELLLTDCRGEGDGAGPETPPASTYRRNNWDADTLFE